MFGSVVALIFVKKVPSMQTNAVVSLLLFVFASTHSILFSAQLPTTEIEHDYWQRPAKCIKLGQQRDTYAPGWDKINWKVLVQEKTSMRSRVRNAREKWERTQARHAYRLSLEKSGGEKFVDTCITPGMSVDVKNKMGRSHYF